MDSQFATPFINSGRQEHPSEVIAMLLSTARLRINQGNPTSALQAVVAALKATGGEGAVLQTLARARDVYQKRMNANAAADELATLFAECAIVEAGSSVPPGSSSQPLEQPLNFVPRSHNFEHSDNMECSSSGEPILAESGRMQVVVDAFSDGSSFICLQCGGLVSNMRRDEHMAYWCALTPQECNR